MRSDSLLAELFGTFVLVFFGCGTVMAHVTGSAIGLPVNGLGVAFAFGLAVTIMAYAIGPISGCHLNPAVTLALAVSKRFAWKDLPGYWVVQVGGAIAAAAALRFVFGDVANLGATLPAPGLSDGALVAAETIATGIFAFVILAVTRAQNPNGALNGVVIGITLGSGLLVLGPLTGGSMNPARSLGPALVGDGLGVVWLYVVGPAVGALLGAQMYEWIRRGDRPRGRVEVPVSP
jgi:MIP family channel proteins